MNRIMTISATLVGGALTTGAVALAGQGHADTDDDRGLSGCAAGCARNG